MSTEQHQGTDIIDVCQYNLNSIHCFKTDEITPNPDQPRRYFEEEALISLSKSLKEHGFINPISIVLDGDKKIIIAGEQRWRAAQLAKIDSVPCIIKPPEKLAELAIAENLLRSDLTAIEKAEALQKLIDNSGISQRKLANKFGKKESTISEILSLTKLPDSIKDICRTDRSFAIRQLKKIASAAPEKQEQMFEAYKSKKDIKLRIPSDKKPSQANILGTAIKLLSSQLQNLNDISDDSKKSELINDLIKLKNEIEATLPETSTRRSSGK